VISSLAPLPLDTHQGPFFRAAQEVPQPTLLKEVMLPEMYVADLAAQPFKRRTNMKTSPLNVRMKDN
jgi:hypothetical protein